MTHLSSWEVNFELFYYKLLSRCENIANIAQNKHIHAKNQHKKTHTHFRDPVYPEACSLFAHTGKNY